MADFVRESNELSVRDTYDVIVVGGGVAGVAAALAARRNGAKTLMLEKSTISGGLATLGLVAIYLPLCDGKGKQVSFGIAEELLKLSTKYGLSTIPKGWQEGTGDVKNRYATNFSPAAFAIAIDELLENEGVDVNYDTVVCKPVMEAGRCTHLVVENKSGRFAYGCGAVVDASGDGDIFARAGAKYEKGENGLTYWSYTVDKELLARGMDAERVMLDDWLDMGGADEYGDCAPQAYSKYDGTDDRQITRFLLDGRRQMRKEIYADGARTDRVIVTLPGMAQMRTTRRIIGAVTIDSQDYNRQFPDSVGCVGDWRQSGMVWQIPYRTLYCSEFENLYAAGRCISATNDAWQATRVIPGAAVSGQAAGTAAALLCREKQTAASLPIALLQQTLEKQGVLLHD